MLRRSHESPLRSENPRDERRPVARRHDQDAATWHVIRQKLHDLGWVRDVLDDVEPDDDVVDAVEECFTHWPRPDVQSALTAGASRRVGVLDAMHAGHMR